VNNTNLHHISHPCQVIASTDQIIAFRQRGASS